MKKGNRIMTKFSSIILTSAALVVGSASASDLTFSQYNPGENAIFPVTSVLVSGEKDAILFDAQFNTQDGQALVDMIKASHKNLSMIYISAGDPDYYFGLQSLVKAFPKVRVVASQAVVEHIQSTKDAKLEYWGPIIGDAAPTNIVVPEILNDTTLMLDGKAIEIKEINTHQAYLWIPSIKAVLGGVSVTSGMHVWTADTQTQASRQEWTESLKKMAALQPDVVIPGHYLGAMPAKAEAISFTIDYLTAFEKELTAVEKLKANKSDAVIKAMKKRYPELPGESDLELSAKVNTGEMQW